ncbi:hypothetical protein [Poriferisphaera sp. WC338]|uniref:hypothetical protein n=1 Tax=Poriferisphaera sp. WC338 TaxID=3425129 RepID=UPI003D817A65
MKHEIHAILFDDDHAVIVADGDVDFKITSIPIIKDQERPSAIVDPKALEDAISNKRINEPLVGLPSDWCYVASIQLNESKRSRLSTMLFQLEEFLPLDAEQVAASFHINSHSAMALGCAIEAKPLQRILAELEDRGISPGAICPKVFFVFHVLQHQKKIPDSCQAIILPEPNGIYSIIQLHSGRIVSWRLLTEKDLLRDEVHVSILSGVDLDQSDNTKLILGVDLSDDLVRELQERCDLKLEIVATPILELLYEGAVDLHRREKVPVFNLRTGPLAVQSSWLRYQKQGVFAALGVCLLLISILVSLSIRARAYRHEFDQANQAMIELYQEAFPGQSVPLGIMGRLQSEQRKLQSTNAESVQLPEQRSMLFTIRDVLSYLPIDIRFKLDELQIEARQIRVYGTTRSHVDANKIVAGLRNIEDYNFELLRTDQTADRTVSFSIVGLLKQKSQPLHISSVRGK